MGYSFILCRSQKKLENVMCKRRRVHGSAEVLIVASKQPMVAAGEPGNQGSGRSGYNCGSENRKY